MVIKRNEDLTLVPLIDSNGSRHVIFVVFYFYFDVSVVGQVFDK
jgi:hypothetical protein